MESAANFWGAKKKFFSRTQILLKREKRKSKEIFLYKRFLLAKIHGIWYNVRVRIRLFLCFVIIFFLPRQSGKKPGYTQKKEKPFQGRFSKL